MKITVISFGKKKSKNNSEFWWVENRVEVRKRGFGGKYANFEVLFASY